MIRLDKRTRFYKTFSGYKTNDYVGAVTLGLLAGLILAVTLYNATHTTPQPTQEMIKTTQSIVQVVKAFETPCDYDPLTYLRCRGEQLGISNENVSRMIRIITQCENKSLNPEAININTDSHKSMDVGIMQINMYWHRKNVKLVDMLDFKKNIDYGYKLYLQQGFNPWSCAKKIK